MLAALSMRAQQKHVGRDTTFVIDNNGVLTSVVSVNLLNLKRCKLVHARELTNARPRSLVSALPVVVVTGSEYLAICEKDNCMFISCRHMCNIATSKCGNLSFEHTSQNRVK